MTKYYTINRIENHMAVFDHRTEIGVLSNTRYINSMFHMELQVVISGLLVQSYDIKYQVRWYDILKVKYLNFKQKCRHFTENVDFFFTKNDG